jgi:hypothetical protein
MVCTWRRRLHTAVAAALLLCASPLVLCAPGHSQLWAAPGGLVPTGLTTELTDGSFDDALLGASGPVLLLVSSPHCGHCVRMRPAWDAACAQLASSGIACARVDASQRVLLVRLKVSGFPDVRLFRGTAMYSYDDGPRTTAALVAWATGGYKHSAAAGVGASPLGLLGRLKGRVLRMPTHAAVVWKDMREKTGLGNTGMVAACVTTLLIGFAAAVLCLDTLISWLPPDAHGGAQR